MGPILCHTAGMDEKTRDVGLTLEVLASLAVWRRRAFANGSSARKDGPTLSIRSCRCLHFIDLHDFFLDALACNRGNDVVDGCPICGQEKARIDVLGAEECDGTLVSLNNVFRMWRRTSQLASTHPGGPAGPSKPQLQNKWPWRSFLPQMIVSQGWGHRKRDPRLAADRSWDGGIYGTK
jgi:hypothetical protein